MTLATVLLVGAALLTKSLVRLQDVSPGFNPAGLLVADAPLSPVSYATQAQRTNFVDRLVPRLKEIPGVKVAAVATAPPFSGTGSTIHFNIVGRPPKGPEDYIATGYRAIGADYFAALGIPVSAGRTFTERDRDRSRPVAIVNETFVRRFLGGDTALALESRAQLGTTPDDEAETPIMDIVGVVGDTRQAFDTAAEPTMFVPYLQHPIEVIGGLYRALTVVLKTDGDPAALAPSLRAAVREIDREQPLARVRTMQEAMNESVAQPRLRTMLLTLFSAVALALSLIGVYGVMAYAVSERTHEIGVRLALGASPRDIRSLVVGEGLRLAAIGITIGIVGALATSRALTTLLFGVSPNDPATFVASAVALTLARGGRRLRTREAREPDRSGRDVAVGRDNVNAQRVIADLRELAARTSTPDGAQRLAWGPVWRDAREWFSGKVAELGLRSDTDSAGNNWVTIPGASATDRHRRQPSRLGAERRMARRLPRRARRARGAAHARRPRRRR